MEKNETNEPKRAWRGLENEPDVFKKREFDPLNYDPLNGSENLRQYCIQHGHNRLSFQQMLEFYTSSMCLFLKDECKEKNISEKRAIEIIDYYAAKMKLFLVADPFCVWLAESEGVNWWELQPELYKSNSEKDEGKDG